MKKRVISLLCVGALVLTMTACAEKPADPTQPTQGEIGAMYNQIDTHNQEKVVTQGSITYSDELKESESSFVLNGLFTDNMVLQRNAVNCIWGTTVQDGEVAVMLNGQTFYGTAQNGAFQIYTGPMAAGGPYDLVVFNSTEKLTIKNVLIGEVFLLAGQSNMQMRVMETMPPAEEEATYANDTIRLLEIKPDYDAQPQDVLLSYEVNPWVSSGETTTPAFSAAGYYFAQELQNKCPGLPVGLVMCCQGATYLSTWLPQYAVDELTNAGIIIPNNTADPKLTAAMHYNAMVNPILNFKFKAVLWYQGEGQPQNYDKALEKLMATWRVVFDSPNMGFVVYTLPRLVVDKYNNYVTVDAGGWFECRRLQMLAVQNTENAVYCVANDLGSYDDIHPLDKKLISTRAAHAFISKFYGSEEILTGPRFESYTVNGNAIDITFTNVGSGLELRNLHLGFEIFSEGYEYVPAQVEIISANQVRITSSAQSPIGFRYGYTNIYPSMTEEQKLDMKNSVCLYNKEGYPAEQFDVVFAFE